MGRRRCGTMARIKLERLVSEKMPGVNMDADLDVVIGAVRAKIENE